MGDKILDLVTSMFQVLLYAIIINSCSKENKLSSINLIKLISLLFITMVFFTTIWGNISICVFITHITALAIDLLFYRKNRIEAVVAFTTVYLGFAIYSIFFGNLFFGYIKEVIKEEYVFYLKVIIMYIPQYILIILFILKREKIIILNKSLMSMKQNIASILLISFILDFVIALYLNIYGTEVELLKNIIISITALFFIGVTIYFNNIQKKSKQISQLNQVLESKNNELRKIKHDYGAQVSYLYGLHLMKRHDDLGKALKNIIDKNSSVHSAAEVIDDQHSLLSLALKPAIEAGIHVIVEENSDLKLSHVNEIDLYRIISNIISNAIRAMDGEGIIVAETYDYFKSTVIKIENNGPKIPQQDLENIFKQGFTTKDNKDNSHGYGLAIVKELVEKYNGKISVKSTESSTEFKIIFPMKEVQNV